jgi:hypothetical protein
MTQRMKEAANRAESTVSFAGRSCETPKHASLRQGRFVNLRYGGAADLHEGQSGSELNGMWGQSDELGRRCTGTWACNSHSPPIHRPKMGGCFGQPTHEYSVFYVLVYFKSDLAEASQWGHPNYISCFKYYVELSPLALPEPA